MLFFINQLVFSQTTISGKLIDEQNKPIPNVSVSYKKVGGAALLGFGQSDNNGLFRLNIKLTDIDSVQLDFQHMNYAKRSVVVVNKSANYAYQLIQQTRELEEVKVGNVPIYKQRDTINYDVNAFSSKQDRVIC